MRVMKRNGSLEPVDVNKIVNAIARASEGLLGVDPMRVATRTISALADGASTRELDELSIRTAAGLIVEEPNYSKLASRLLATVIDKEVRNQEIHSFTQSIQRGLELGLISEPVARPTRAAARNAQPSTAPRASSGTPPARPKTSTMMLSLGLLGPTGTSGILGGSITLNCPASLL